MKQLHYMVLVFLMAGLISLQAQLKVAGSGETLLIKDGTVLTITNGTIENGDILIKNGKITAVKQEIKAANNMKIIDASGMYVMPGIIDSHSHMGIEGGINEATSTIVPQISIAEVVRHDDLAFQRALAGGVTAINTLHGSANPIGGLNAVLKLKFGKPAEEILIKEAQKSVKFALGENPKRVHPFPDTRMGVIFSVRRAFTEAKEYMQKWDEYQQKKKGKMKRTAWEKEYGLIPPQKDYTMETLAEVLKGKIDVICHGYRADEMLALMQLADEIGFTIGSFEHCLEGYKIAKELKKHNVVASMFADAWAYKMEAFDAIPYNCALLTRQGVLVTINSDSNERVRRLYQEAAKAVKYGGLNETEALKTITLNPARRLGLEHRLGSIEKGKDADLAIFNGHPFSVYSRVEMTLIEGEVYFNRSTCPTVNTILSQLNKEKEE